MWNRFDRITIAVSDLEVAKQRMVCVLGRTPSWSATHPGEKRETVLFRLDNVDIELIAPTADARADDPLRGRIEDSGDHVDSLSFLTDDAEAAVETLRKNGVSVEPPALRLSQDAPSGAFRRTREFEISSADANGVRLFGVENLSLPEEMPPSPPVASEETVCHAIDHVVLITNDPERAKRFYGENLELRLALDRSFEERGSRILFFRLGGLTLEIGASTQQASSDDREREEDRFWGLAYQVASADLARARIHDDGIEVSEVREGFKPGTRVFTIKDETVRLPSLMIEPASCRDR